MHDAKVDFPVVVTVCGYDRLPALSAEGVLLLAACKYVGLLAPTPDGTNVHVATGVTTCGYDRLPAWSAEAVLLFAACRYDRQLAPTPDAKVDVAVGAVPASRRLAPASGHLTQGAAEMSSCNTALPVCRAAVRHVRWRASIGWYDASCTAAPPDDGGILLEAMFILFEV
mmetsp:Transcript_41220/g.78988  ORF Transcript_41220/g.78988 Transcript_41220/m.78988 type:complete len:170 (-) Transcript_41220:991-1500(-)